MTATAMSTTSRPTPRPTTTRRQMRWVCRRRSTAASIRTCCSRPDQTPSSQYTATDIVAVPSTASNYTRFWAPTRFETAKTGLAQAVTENQTFVRWGLMKLRQAGRGLAQHSASNDCDSSGASAEQHDAVVFAGQTGRRATPAASVDWASAATRRSSSTRRHQRAQLQTSRRRPAMPWSTRWAARARPRTS